MARPVIWWRARQRWRRSKRLSPLASRRAGSRTRINSVNVSVLIRRIRRAAVKEQIDLDAPFMPPVGTGEFEKLMECDYFKGRDQLFTDSKTIKSREAAGAKHGEAARAMVMQ